MATEGPSAERVADALAEASGADPGELRGHVRRKLDVARPGYADAG